MRIAMSRTASPAYVAKRTKVRYAILLLIFLITTFNYADRATLSIFCFAHSCVKVVIERVDEALPSSGARGVKSLPEPEGGVFPSMKRNISWEKIGSLSGHPSKSRSVVPSRISQRAHERIRHRASTSPPFVVTVVVQNERDVHVVATGPVSLPIGIWIRVSGEELESRGGKITLLASGKDGGIVLRHASQSHRRVLDDNLAAFLAENGVPRQVVAPHLDLKLAVVNLEKIPDAGREAELQRRLLASVAPWPPFPPLPPAPPDPPAAA